MSNINREGNEPKRARRSSEITSEDILERNNGRMMVIACVVENRARETVVAVARSWRSLEIFTLVDNPSYAETVDLLSHLAPEEILLHGSSCQGSTKSLLCRKIEKWRETFEGHPVIKPVSRAYFDQDRGAEFLRRVSISQIDSEIMARYTVLGATFALLKYIETTASMTFPRRSVKLNFIDNSAGDFLIIDRRTSSCLEVLNNARTGDQKNCLFGKIDRTKTVGGARLLRQQLLRPSADVATISARQDVANYLLDNEDVLSSVMDHLRRVPDLDKILNRLVSMQEGKSNARVVGANIKTIIAIKHTMIVMEDLVSSLHMHDDGMDNNEQGAEEDNVSGSELPELLEAIESNMIPPCSRSIQERITSVITESTMLTKGSLSAQHEECFAISIGTDGMLDVARKTYLQTVEDIYELAEGLAREFDCSVKVHNTQARGYHLKLPGNLESLPGDCFIQCVKSSKFIACTTREIASLSDRAQEALQEALTITDRITFDLLVWIQGFLNDLFAVAESTAMLDMLCGFAELNLTSSRVWCCPTVREDVPLSIKQGRHQIMAELSDEHGKVLIEADGNGDGKPVAQQSARSTEVGFIPNDTFLDSSSSLHVVSGVNGSGKTTYIKQVALIVILAQIGCFVPAQEASIPVRNRLLSRIGTGDDIENNLSTFLMEMKDAAYICKHKNDKSLVLLDELGRGTANRDGSAIAWTVAETLLATNSNLCLFVTHYPLLLNLATIYPAVKNVHMAIDVSGGKLSRYRHTLTAGSSSLETDYGIDLAERMGIENDVLERARAIKAKIIVAAPPGVDEALTGGDMGRLASTLKVLLRRLSSLKGASIDDRTLRSYLDRIKSQLPPDKQLRLLQALQADN